MPLYHYKCNHCNESFDIRHSYNASGVQCKFCDTKELQKVLSVPPRRVVVRKSFDQKTGTEVNKTIRETRLEIDKTKKQKSQRIYKKGKKQ